MLRFDSPASKRSNLNAPYPGSVITAGPTGTRPVIAFILRAASNAWATTAQRNVRAIRTQTVHPPVSYVNKRPRPIIWDARVLQRPHRPRKAAPAPARAVSSTLSYTRTAAGPRNARPQRKTIRRPQTIKWYLSSVKISTSSNQKNTVARQPSHCEARLNKDVKSERKRCPSFVHRHTAKSVHPVYSEEEASRDFRDLEEGKKEDMSQVCAALRRRVPKARKPAPLHRFLVHGQSSYDKQRPYAVSPKSVPLFVEEFQRRGNQRRCTVFSSTASRAMISSVHTPCWRLILQMKIGSIQQPSFQQWHTCRVLLGIMMGLIRLASSLLLLRTPHQQLNIATKAVISYAVCRA
ncbi:hypothetical protein EVAR_98568_1 [Eumeta japonica]|uniref:Uncharacterized protein n=1 Tax=Eumeta variegata TaxID=151549 RepID=A0A4C1YQB1_EUMVA|nr:hypothetical protein EVAR_98568_1 [Eumeta japonica]